MYLIGKFMNNFPLNSFWEGACLPDAWGRQVDGWVSEGALQVHFCLEFDA